MGRVLADHDFHPDQPTVRIFRTPPAGVLRLDDSVAISEADYGGTVLRHYAFAGRWFKVNVTTDRGGRLTETGDRTRKFAFDCDIATPMECEGDSTFAADLFTDVLVRQDGTSHVVADRDEFREMLGRGVISAAEGRGAERGLRELVDLIEAGWLLRWPSDLVPFGPCRPPRARPIRARPGPRPPAAWYPSDLVTGMVRAGTRARHRAVRPYPGQCAPARPARRRCRRPATWPA